MLRGSVDFVGPDRISGWVYCELGSVTGRRVLAFNGDQCIGAGEVNISREDLRAAGLGDGVLGFNIPVNTASIKDLLQLHVRLEYSDFSLFERRFHQKLVTSGKENQKIYSSDELERVNWMSRQGWLTQDQYLSLHALNSMGYVQKTFSRAELVETSLADRAKAAFESALSAQLRADVQAAVTKLDDVSPRSGMALFDDQLHDVVAIYGAPFELMVFEGNQANGGLHTGEPVLLRSEAHQLLLAHIGCLGEIRVVGEADITVLRAAV